MRLHERKTFVEYLQLVRENENEMHQLRQDLLIGVTSFFRNTAAFSALDAEVIAPLVADKHPDEPIRIWVPGCATGEEAYSIAMLVIEQLKKAGKNCPLQIFASDIDESALAIARAGLYQQESVAALPPSYLERFFVQNGHNYQASRPLREAILFTTQNLISDLPFSNLDLVTCRNVLIYLNIDLQNKIFRLFHFVLRKRGCLFLGNSEMVSEDEGLFEPINKEWRIYRRVGDSRLPLLDLPTRMLRSAYTPAADRKIADRSLADVMKQSLFNNFVPAAVLVDSKGDVLQFSGKTGPFLEQPTGAPTRNLFALVRRELQAKLRDALRGAVADNKLVEIDDAHVVDRVGRRRIKLTLRPISIPGSIERLFLIAFENRPDQPAQHESREYNWVPPERSLVQGIEDELRITREELQEKILELELTNQEFQAANEEMMSVNEELQASNEEMETSKEELQATNEELSTVNNELKIKIGELAESNDDLSNLLRSTDIPILFVDAERLIRRFTPSMATVMNIMPSDVGRPLIDLRLKVTDPNLLDDIDLVISGRAVAAREIMGTEEKCYLRQISRYQAHSNDISGAVISFVDISPQLRAYAESQRLAVVLRDSTDALTVQGMDGHIIAWNKGAEGLYGWKEEEALKMNASVLRSKDALQVEPSIIQRLLRGEKIPSVETKRRHKNGAEIDVWATVTPLVDRDGRITAVATTDRDVTERNAAISARLRAETRYENLARQVPVGLFTFKLDPFGKFIITYASPRYCELLGVTAESVTSDPNLLFEIIHSADSKLLRDILKKMSLASDSFEYDLRFIVHGEVRHIRTTVNLGGDQCGGIEGSGSILDVTEQLLTQEERARLSAQLTQSQKMEAMGQLSAGVAHHFNNIIHNIINFVELAKKLGTPDSNSVLDPILDKIERSAESGADLVSSLLRYSQPTDLLEAIQPIDAHSVIRTALVLIHTLLPRGITLAYAHDEHLPLIAIRAAELQDAIRNLVLNACEAQGNRGEIQINLHGAMSAEGICAACQQPFKGQFVEVEVIDKGPGIKGEILSDIFQPFFSTKEVGNGSGLGLSLVHGLVHAVGGHILVESELGRRTAFKLLFPPVLTEPSPHADDGVGRNLISPD